MKTKENEPAQFPGFPGVILTGEGNVILTLNEGILKQYRWADKVPSISVGERLTTTVTKAPGPDESMTITTVRGPKRIVVRRQGNVWDWSEELVPPTVVLPPEAPKVVIPPKPAPGGIATYIGLGQIITEAGEQYSSALTYEGSFELMNNGGAKLGSTYFSPSTAWNVEDPKKIFSLEKAAGRKSMVYWRVDNRWRRFFFLPRGLHTFLSQERPGWYELLVYASPSWQPPVPILKHLLLFLFLAPIWAFVGVLAYRHFTETPVLYWGNKSITEIPFQESMTHPLAPIFYGPPIALGAFLLSGLIALALPRFRPTFFYPFWWIRYLFGLAIVLSPLLFPLYFFRKNVDDPQLWSPVTIFSIAAGSLMVAAVTFPVGYLFIIKPLGYFCRGACPFYPSK